MTHLAKLVGVMVDWYSVIGSVILMLMHFPVEIFIKAPSIYRQWCDHFRSIILHRPFEEWNVCRVYHWRLLWVRVYVFDTVIMHANIMALKIMDLNLCQILSIRNFAHLRERMWAITREGEASGVRERAAFKLIQCPKNRSSQHFSQSIVSSLSSC